MSSGKGLPFLSSKYSVCWAGFDHWREVLSLWSTLQVKFAVPPSTTVTFCVSGNCPWLPEEGREERGGMEKGREKEKTRKDLSCRTEFVAANSHSEIYSDQRKVVQEIEKKKLYSQYILCIQETD